MTEELKCPTPAGNSRRLERAAHLYVELKVFIQTALSGKASVTTQVGLY